MTTDDAASAVVAALRAPTGVYNVADDRPLRRAEQSEALAEALGTGPLSPPAVNAAFPKDLSMMLRSLRVTSERFKELTDWRPRLPSAWEGWRFVVAEFQQRHGPSASDRSARRAAPPDGLNQAVAASRPRLPRGEP